jgi:hypothetical protein
MKTQLFFQASKLSFTITLLFALLASSCQKDDDNDLPRQPEPSASRVKQITYAPTDFQSFEYDPDGRWSRYYTQWQYVQNDPGVIRKLTYDFHYDKASRLTQLTTVEGGYPVNYYYENGILTKTEERNHKNQVEVRRTYSFDGDRLMEEKLETNLASGEAAQYTIRFEYDAKGNLTRETTWAPKASGQALEVYGSIEYSDFDTNKNPDNRLMRFPYLPWVIFHINNPGKKTMKGPNGQVISEEILTYQYDSSDYPSQKKRKLVYDGASAELTASYSYY